MQIEMSVMFLFSVILMVTPGSEAFEENENETKYACKRKIAPPHQASPMQPYCKGFPVIKALGLPLKISGKNGANVSFDDKHRLVKFGSKVGKKESPGILINL